MCHDGFLGKECNLLCPRSAENSKLCHGRGECAVNEAFQPTCKCERGHLGKDCSIPCPGAAGDLGACSDHGSCVLDDSGLTAKCNCNDGFLGEDCFLACPRDQADNVCSNHGECSAIGDNDTKCTCQAGWVGKAFATLRLSSMKWGSTALKFSTPQRSPWSSYMGLVRGRPLGL